MNDTTVKYFSSSDTGAPSLTYAAGSLLSVLDACLVTGFGSVTLTSLVVSNNVATATVNAGHGFAANSLGGGNTGTQLPVITIAGATPAGLNGEWRLASIPSATTFTFLTAGISNQTATGTITAKRSPLGWTKPYTGTNKAAFRNNSTSGTGAYLRLDDSATYENIIYGYSSMDSIDVGINRVGAYWAKSYSGQTGTKQWFVVGNDRIFYVGIGWHDSYPHYMVYAFGDYISPRPGYPYRYAIFGQPSAAYANASSYSPVFSYSNSGYGVVPRPITGAGTYTTILSRFLTPMMLGASGQGSGYFGSTITCPNTIDNGLYLTPTVMIDSNGWFYGELPGIRCSWQSINTTMVYGSVRSEILGSLEYPDRVLLAHSAYNTGSNTIYLTGFIDITGPWDA